MNMALVLGLSVPGSLVILALVVLLVVYMVRHHRLQRSFLSFANSHYDTRSGTTTFNTGDDLGEHLTSSDSANVEGRNFILYTVIEVFKVKSTSM